MTAWTPANLTTPARLYVNAASAVFVGTALTAIANSGADGGLGAPQGSIVKGSVYNGVQSWRHDADNKYVEFALGTISSGVMFCSAAQAFVGSSGAQGMLNGRWADGGSAVFYARNDPSGMYAFYRRLDLTFAPSAGTSGIVSGSGVHHWSEQLGTTRAIYIDGVSQILDLYDANAAVASINARTWEVGRGQYSGAAADEGLQGDFLYVLLLDYAPSTDDRQRIEGWASWAFQGDGSLLPVGHPYKTAAPLVSFSGYGAGTYGTGNYSVTGAPVNAAAAIIESQDTSSASGSVKIKAAASVSEAGDTVAAASQLRLQAASSISEGADTLSAQGGAKASTIGAAAITEAADTLASSGMLRIRAVADLTEATDSLSATGFHVGGPVLAAASITEADDVLTATVFSWRPVPPADEIWTPIPANDEVWSAVAPTAAIWS